MERQIRWVIITDYTIQYTPYTEKYLQFAKDKEVIYNIILQNIMAQLQCSLDEALCRVSSSDMKDHRFTEYCSNILTNVSY